VRSFVGTDSLLVAAALLLGGRLSLRRFAEPQHALSSRAALARDLLLSNAPGAKERCPSCPDSGREPGSAAFCGCSLRPQLSPHEAQLEYMPRMNLRNGTPFARTFSAGLKTPPSQKAFAVVQAPTPEQSRQAREKIVSGFLGSAILLNGGVGSRSRKRQPGDWRSQGQLAAWSLGTCEIESVGRFLSRRTTP
jgi:hypothetical protein